MQGPEEPDVNLHDVLDRVTDAFFVLDGKWRFTYMNSGAERILARKNGSVLGKKLHEGLPEAVAEPLYRELRRSIGEQAAIDFQQHHPELGAWFEIRAYPLESGIAVSFREENGHGQGEESRIRPENDKVTMDFATAQDLTAQKRDENALPLLASTVENSEDAIVGNTLDGIVTSWNPAAERLFGYSAEEMIGESVSILNIPGKPESLEQIWRVSRTGAPENQETVRVAKDGTRMEVSVTRSPIRDAAGEIIGTSSICKDISRRKASERALMESEERFRNLVELSPDAVIVHSEGIIEYINLSGTRLLGAERPEEILGKPVMSIVHPDDRDAAQERVSRLHARGGQMGPAEERLLRVDGGSVEVEVTGLPITYDGRPAVQSLARNITERKRAEEALHSERNLLRSVMDSTSDAIFAKDSEHRFRLSNAAHQRIMGAGSQEEILGRTNAEYWGEETAAPFHSDDRRVLDHGESIVDREERVRGASGSEMWISTTKAPLRDFSGRIEGLVAVSRDITDRRREQHKLATTVARLGSLIQNMPSGILVEDEGRNIRHANDEIARMFEMEATAEELASGEWDTAARDVMNLFADPESFAERVEEILATGDPVIGEEVPLADGRVYERDYVPVFVGEEYRGHMWHYRDLTRHKRAEESLRQSEVRFRAVFDQTAVGMCVADLDRRLIQTNEAYQQITGYSGEELVGMSTLDLTHPEDRATDTGKRRTFVSDESDSYRRSKRYVRKDGEVIWAEATSSLVRDEQGEPRFIMGVVEDVTERKRSQEALRENERLLQAVTRGAPVILFATDHEGVLTLAEGKALDLFSLKPGKVVGRSVFEAYRDLTQVVDNVRRALAGEEVAETVELEGVTFEARYSPMRDGKGEITGSVGVATDVTTRRELEKEMEHRAFHDPLTDLPNRALFMDRLEHALTRTSRRGERVAVLFLDLDDFKHVNDSLGHSAGDRLLIAAGQRIKSCLRDEDTVARLGGDEFAVLLEDVPDLDFPKKVAQRIASELRSPITLSEDAEEAGPEIIVTTSIGMALNEPEDDSIDAEEILQRADTALYRAKETGKDHHELFHQEMKERSTEFLRMGRDLRRALERKELTVHYQLKKNLQTGEASGMEALVRWEHPERGLVYPDKFISLAEDNGLIVPLGLQVLREACGQAKEWQELYPTGPGQPPLAICVNLSVRQLQSPGLVEDVAGILAETGLEPSSALLEITESTFIRQDSQVTSALHSLKELGVKLAIDDFGSGYSSLSYLNDLPVDVLKIDRSLVTGMGTEPAKAEIVSAAISVAHALGLQAVAEGVETAGELEELRKLGCDFGQGYYWSKPLPANAAATLLQRPASK